MFMKLEIPLALGFKINHIYNLINRIEYNTKWNKFIVKFDQKIENIYQSEIAEVREYKPYFCFPRVYHYLRQSFYYNNRIFIVDKHFDAKDDSDLVEGQIKNGVWSLTNNENTITVTLNTHQVVEGLTITKEEQFMIQKYIFEAKNLLEYLQNNKESILNNPDLNQPVFEKEMEPVNDKLIQDDIEDEFYDCEDLQSSVSYLSHQQINQGLYFEKIEEDLQKWVERKMREFQTNEYWKIPLDIIHQQTPYESSEKVYVKEIEGGNFLYRRDWQRDEKNGGLRLISQAKIDAQKKVIHFLLGRIGSTLLTGKSLTNLSMPVYIFENRAVLERFCNSMAFAPTFLDKAAQLDQNDFLGRLKLSMLFNFGFLITFLSIEKPFNPILGETYQGWIDKCPIIAEQVSHHPPITRIQLFGRGYSVDARIEMQANIHSNSITGKNIGYLKIMYPNQTIYCMLAPGIIHGTMFGDRIFLFSGKNMTIDLEHKIAAEIGFNPDKKYCNNLKKKPPNQADYILGGIYEVTDAAIERYQKETFRKYQGLDFKLEIKNILHIVEGNWTTKIFVLQQ